MNNAWKLDFGGRGKPTRILGLAFEGNRLDGVVLRRQNGSLQAAHAFRADLTLDPLTNEVELVGREILNHVEAAGASERRCAVVVPLKWALTAHTKLPEISEAELDGFLQLEAERSFPCDVTSLRVCTSLYAGPSGERYAAFVGVPRSHLERLEQVLHAAKLKPVSFGLGISAVQPPAAEASNGVLALLAGENNVGLQITCGGGVAALRALEGAMEFEGGERILHGDLIAREVRITLAQLPADVRGAVKRIRIFGAPAVAGPLTDAIRSRFEAAGLAVESVSGYPANEFGVTIPADTPAAPAFSLAARHLTGCKDPFEFLPPKVSAWKRITAQYSSDRLRTAGAVAATAILLVAAVFGYQQWELFRLSHRWSGMASTVHDLEGIQRQIQQYRPWFDESFRCLTIMRRLSAAFPEDGAVTAKTLEIRDKDVVSCSGTARDNGALLQTLNRLRGLDGVHDVTVDAIRGHAPMQFTFNFRYGENNPNQN